MSLSFDPSALDLPLGHWIDGKMLTGAGALRMVRPSDAAPFAHSPVADAELVDEAVRNARAALKASNWGGVLPRERLRVLHRLADLMVEESATLARLEAFCSTRPVRSVVAGDIAFSAEQLRFFAEFADKEGGDLVPTDDASLGMIMTEPYGVVGAITPWNFPLNMAIWKIGPALAAGNAVVIKPSEMTPFSTLFVAQLAIRAGLPPGLFNVVLGDGATTGTALTGHEGIDKVSFTGSTLAGSAIMENIARTGVKPMTLELGGKSPQIVFADADLDKAATAIAGNILANAGQACICGTRLIVEESIAEDFAARIMARMTNVTPGPTWDEASTYSPIISRRQLDRIDSLVQAAIAQGAQCLQGGKVMDAPGYFYAPTLLAGVTQDSPAVQEEIFGPVLTLQTFADEAEALALADHPAYGLAAGLFSRDVSRVLRLTRALQAGTIWVNRYGRSYDHILPTGGYKRSGIGKDLGREAYLANRKSKSVLIGL